MGRRRGRPRRLGRRPPRRRRALGGARRLGLAGAGVEARRRHPRAGRPRDRRALRRRRGRRGPAVERDRTGVAAAGRRRGRSRAVAVRDRHERQDDDHRNDRLHPEGGRAGRTGRGQHRRAGGPGRHADGPARPARLRRRALLLPAADHPHRLASGVRVPQRRRRPPRMARKPRSLLGGQGARLRSRPLGARLPGGRPPGRAHGRRRPRGRPNRRRHARASVGRPDRARRRRRRRPGLRRRTEPPSCSPFRTSPTWRPAPGCPRTSCGTP